MTYNTQLAHRVRHYLLQKSGIDIEEKTMFGGLAFLVNGKMCVNITGNQLMCRYDPSLEARLAEEPGYQPMLMRGKILSGYCLVDAEVLDTPKALTFWVDICLAYNPKAKVSKQKNKR